MFLHAFSTLCNESHFKGPVTRVAHKPTYEERMPFLASVDIRSVPV